LEEIPVMLGDSLIEGEINVENVNDEQWKQFAQLLHKN
jgi:hypothetical protein